MSTSSGWKCNEGGGSRLLGNVGGSLFKYDVMYELASLKLLFF
jgi:hypothetical protein